MLSRIVIITHQNIVLAFTFNRLKWKILKSALNDTEGSWRHIGKALDEMSHDIYTTYIGSKKTVHLTAFLCVSSVVFGWIIHRLSDACAICLLKIKHSEWWGSLANTRFL